MTEEKIQLIIGGLLHDIGKVIYRQGGNVQHGISGCKYLKEEAHVENKNVLEAVRYHHGAELKAAAVADNSSAYITYIADNIASASDGRKSNGTESSFKVSAPLEPVFNILNGNSKKMYYSPTMLTEKINNPTEIKKEFDEHFYQNVKKNLTDNLAEMEWNENYINSLLDTLERNLSYVPASASSDEIADISLYDHVKLTAAAGSCIYDYLKEKNITDYKTTLFLNASQFYSENAFLLFSMDISGIQSFIYTVHSKGALKTLRARSFYLEIMMEHIVDELLKRAGLSRANLIYSGGGHCYILLPNTDAVKQMLKQYETELNQWLLEQFDIALYVAAGYSECSANALKNEPAGSYSDIFRNISLSISEKKSRRYTPHQIKILNSRKEADYTRECRVCKKLDRLNADNLCAACEAIAGISNNILYTDFFVTGSEKERNSLPLPFGAYLYAENEWHLKERQKTDSIIRVYCKNKMFTGKYVSSRLWVGSYTTGETFEELAKASEGIERIGILRADVDNLGRTFVSGFKDGQNNDRYATLSRTAALSRQLSIFFKYYINYVLENPVFSINGIKPEKRKATIVYSGGDDLFIVGAWNDVLELSVDIKQAFEKYTEGTLSLSAGIGLYNAGYPIHVIAEEVAGLEDDSKANPGKNSVTFLPDGCVHSEYDETEDSYLEINDATYAWDIFVNEVIGEKYRAVYEFFSSSEERGKNFLYNLLELVRRQDDKINLARYVYLLARMEPQANASAEEKERYKTFSRKMYQWIKEEKDCRQLKTAITLYAYIIRDKGDTK